jgi:hypothetical protein
MSNSEVFSFPSIFSIPCSIFDIYPPLLGRVHFYLPGPFPTILYCVQEWILKGQKALGANRIRIFLGMLYDFNNPGKNRLRAGQ